MTTSARGAKKSPARCWRSTARSKIRCRICSRCSEFRRGDARLDEMDAAIRRRRTREAVKSLIVRESLNQPLIVIFEDLHWIDAESEALLQLLADTIGTAQILMMVNYRPEYRHNWGNKTYYTQMRLDPLGRGKCDRAADRDAGRCAAARAAKGDDYRAHRGQPVLHRGDGAGVVRRRRAGARRHRVARSPAYFDRDTVNRQGHPGRAHRQARARRQRPAAIARGDRQGISA